ncbi:MAG: alpha/beta fold hydrolase [Planctomycetales bacterium]|nr:alpha/beta fold hydrolase [Planctomycetales bacterium]
MNRSVNPSYRRRLMQFPRWLVVTILLGLGFPVAVVGQSPSLDEPRSPLPAPDPNEEPVGYLNFSLGTMGGKQFWTDWYHRAGWRIQQNVFSGHYRLLDENNTRHAWGNYSHCLQELNRLQPRDPDADRLPDVVILLHGLGRSRSSWDSLETSLHRDGFRVVDFGYASTRATIDEHADALHHVITHLDNVEHISFVGHSLGNLVVRRYLAKYPPRANERPEHKRMVMLGPPNQGAELARRLRDNAIFYLFGGEPGQQLAREWQDVEPLLATPEFEFGILAGGEDSDFSNPLVRGEDDLIVSLEETRLPGAVDFRHVESMHTFMPWNEEVMRMTRHFLAEGNFESHATRQPIAREPADPFRR